MIQTLVHLDLKVDCVSDDEMSDAEHRVPKMFGRARHEIRILFLDISLIPTAESVALASSPRRDRVRREGGKTYHDPGFIVNVLRAAAVILI
jgi:hypothetical protein